MGSMAPDWRAVGATPVGDTDMPTTGSGRQAPSTRSIAWAVAAVVALLVLGAMGALLVMPGTGGVVIDAAAVDGTWTRGAVPAALGSLDVETGPTGVTAARPLVVDVEGAVARPGLVRLPAGGRIGDAIELAGGFAPNADLSAAASELNLAQVVSDGLKVVVPGIGDVARARDDTSAPSGGSGGPIDLNQATEAQLDSLPGVGPATIAKIVAARAATPFATIDDLRTRGIVGEATFGRLRDLVTVGR